MSESISDVLHEVVSDLLDEKGYDRPRELNNGDCPTVAARVCSRVPDAEKKTGLTVFKGTHRRRYPAHTWIVYDGLCYDAECISGTPYWHNLPIFRRGLSINPEHVKSRYRTEQLEEQL